MGNWLSGHPGCPLSSLLSGEEDWHRLRERQSNLQVLHLCTEIPHEHWKCSSKYYPALLWWPTGSTGRCSFAQDTCFVMDCWFAEHCFVRNILFRLNVSIGYCYEGYVTPSGFKWHFQKTPLKKSTINMLTTVCIERNEKNGIAIQGQCGARFRSKGIIICSKKRILRLLGLLSMGLLKFSSL